MKTVQAMLFSLVSTGGRAEKADSGKPGMSETSSISGFLGLLILALILALLVAFATGTAYAQGTGKALEFDGVDDYVEVPYSASLNSSQVTLEAWIHLNSQTPGENWHIIHKPYSSSGDVNPFNQYTLFFPYNSLCPKLGLIIGGTLREVASPEEIALNTWHFIVGTYDGNAMKIYVDGELKNSLSVVGSVSSYSTSLTIGRHYHITSWVIDAIIDEVRIWNVALTESQIREMMCKKITSSSLASGLAWSNLNAYWRFDESSGTVCADYSANGNTATMANMDPASDRVWSGAAIGDASAYDYTGSVPGDFSSLLAHSDGDNITATGDGGTVTGIQVYRVDATSMRTDATQPSGWTVDPLRYWGAFIAGSSPTYTITYNYDGHPGITEEGPNDLALAYRDDHADNSWADLGATWDPGANTLTKTGQTGTEYALCSPTGDNSLPVELSSFTAQAGDGKVTLRWSTESETDNLGFHVYRALKEERVYVRLTSVMLEGAGNTSTQQTYRFSDIRLTNGVTYWYKLEDVAFDGTRTMHGPISVTPQAEIVAETQTLPAEFGLSQNAPNPFNPQTMMAYQLPEASEVRLTIYNMAGQRIRTLVEATKEAGSYQVVWNGADEAGKPVAGGMYLYELLAGDFVQTRRMVLIR